MLRRLLDIYALASDFHRMAVNKSCLELDDMAKHLYNKWYIPSIAAENPDTVKKLKKFFKEFSAEQLASTVKTSVDLYKLALNRGLTPGGIVLYSGGNQIKLHWFAGQDVINEFWFYTAATQNTPAGWIALDKDNNLDAKSKTLKNHNLKLLHGTVFFVPFDGRNTSALAEKIRKDAVKNKVHVISWPETWPLNKR